jgi:ribosomal protein S6--L-glutamate ligase
MRLLILSRRPRLYSTQRLYLVAKARRHVAQIANPSRCSLVIARGKLSFQIEGASLGMFDAVIPRLGPSAGVPTQALLRQLELLGKVMLNSSEAISRAGDKLRTLQLLAAAGLPILATAFARRPEDVQSVLDGVGGAPCVIKFVTGTQGVGVMLAESERGAQSIIEALHAAKRDLLIQQFAAGTTDARLFVVGKRVIAAMTRSAQAGDFRANLHRGASAQVLHPDPPLARLAVDATRTLGLECAGVDVVATPDGPAILEVNASPGLEGIEAASGCNVALAIIKHLETRVAQRVAPA